MVCMHEEDSRELPHMSSLFLEAQPRLCPPLLASLSTYQTHAPKEAVGRACIVLRTGRFLPFLVLIGL